MEVSLINQSAVRMPRKWIVAWLEQLADQLRLKDDSELTVVFLNPPQAKKINNLYRGRNYATDILSFATVAGDGKRSRVQGELAICPQVLQKQAKEHELSFQLELAYMLTHGVLHLLGHDHEGEGKKAQRQAKKMYQLQDQLFDSIAKEFDL